MRTSAFIVLMSTPTAAIFPSIAVNSSVHFDDCRVAKISTYEQKLSVYYKGIIVTECSRTQKDSAPFKKAVAHANYTIRVPLQKAAWDCRHQVERGDTRKIQAQKPECSSVHPFTFCTHIGTLDIMHA